MALRIPTTLNDCRLSLLWFVMVREPWCQGRRRIAEGVGYIGYGFFATAAPYVINIVLSMTVKMAVTMLMRIACTSPSAPRSAPL